MTVKKNKLKFVCFFLSLTTVIAFAGANATVVAESRVSPTSSDASVNDENEEKMATWEIVDPPMTEKTNNEPSVGTMSSSSAARTTSYEAYEQYDFPDGVYALHSVGNENRWMDIQQNLTTPGAHVQQYAFNTSPADDYQTSGLFRITKVSSSGTNRYTIRLISNPNLTFTYDTNGNVVTKTIPAEDADVSLADTFYISYQENGFVIRKYGTNLYVCANDTMASGASGAPDSFLIAEQMTDIADETHAMWNLEGYDTPITEGVYGFQNIGNSGMWMDTQQDLAQVGVHIQQYKYATPPTETFSRGGLFKISRVSGTNRYVIRSMLDNCLSFGISGNEVLTKEIADYDAGVLNADTFRIRYYHDGFIIQPYNSSYVIAPNQTSASGSAGAPSSYLTKAEKSSDMNAQAYWLPYRYTGVARRGCLLTYPASWTSTGMVVGSSGTAKLQTWFTQINANRPSMAINPEYSDLATLSWDASNHQMTLQANNPGYLRIEARILTGSTTSIAYGGVYYFSLVPQEGVYYIQNAATQKYVELEGASSASGGIVQQWSFHTADEMKWMIEHVENSNGYIRLKSVHSNLYIGVDSSNTSSIKQYGTQNDYTLWKIGRSTLGNLVFMCKATESTGSALAVPPSSNSNGTNLTQITYSDDADDKDEWYLYKLGDYKVNVSVVYDQAYSNRYSNAYSRISNQILALQEKYMQDFGIIVNNVSLTAFSSYADTYCTTDYTAECSHASEPCRNSTLRGGSANLYSLHHTNIYNIMLRIPFPDLSSTVKVAYIGHEICTQTTHEGHPTYGLTYESIGLATIVNFTSEVKETKTFIHEFGHFYLVVDHYGGSAKSTEQMIDETGNTGYSEDCIYGEHKEWPSVLNNFTICDGCKTTIKNNMSRFNHS